MNPKDLKEILQALEQADVREFSLKTPDYDLSIKRGAESVAVYAQAPQVQAPQPQAMPAQQAPVAAAPTPAAQPEASAPAVVAPAAAAPGTPVKAPIVGTFYASSSPDAAAYVKVGDSIKAGQVLCIIEAMKLMNEIEAETSGTLREILVKNAEPVEYGQTLFIIE
ncbi:acetyl-CoA carboxylase biotin carboxyl carrier protein [Deinococcus sp. KNUC1210]|uniref:acetyl-CoA carboxylase biotin carboxyl carrier protein n=1 Tax=Deinococcus sp. KNUC1210 TaxID=2917691 RepID=UPI001EF0ECC5|nr:acetyl-CoA carboxylase biotin carboxyl carrier protein [Deinococcus sp. KNUC1210]ULH15811.1 acetyl-CoA carboxylase biotin carboxyl carrier protein [Deinococcus sp. KNUC1210]